MAVKATLIITINSNIIPENELREDLEHIVEQVDDLGYIHESTIQIEEV